MATNDIKQAIIARMDSHGLGGLVGASGARRFYSMEAPPDANLPWVAFQRAGGTGVYASGTNKRAPQADFFFRIAAASTSSLEAVQQQLLACFDQSASWPATFAGVQVDKARVLSDGIDDFDSGSRIYQTVMVFQFGWIV